MLGAFLRILLITAIGFGAVLLTGPVGAQSGQGHGHGADGTGHNMMTMPGLRGEDATDEESRELAVMFRNFPLLSRTVENLPDGIRTVTYADHPELLDILVSHVTGMLTRVEEGRDPGIVIQSPTLDILFERRDTIDTEIESTEGGIIVTQTSTDPEVVAALQLHAVEVTAMVDQGMHAVHQMMMQRAGN